MGKLVRMLVGGVGVAMVLCSGQAEAKGRKGKAVVCESYSIVEDRGATELEVAVCYDKRTPGGLTLTTWTEVTVSSPEGPKTVVVGYR